LVFKINYDFINDILHKAFDRLSRVSDLKVNENNQSLGNFYPNLVFLAVTFQPGTLES